MGQADREDGTSLRRAGPRVHRGQPDPRCPPLTLLRPRTPSLWARGCQVATCQREEQHPGHRNGLWGESLCPWG